MIIELNEAKMKTMKEVADMNLLISGMKAEMIALENEKEKYFEDRRQEVLLRINNLLKDSRDVLEETKTNYEKVHQFNDTIRVFGETLSKAYSDFRELVEDFNLKVIKDKQELKRQEEEVCKLRNDLKLDEEKHERDVKFFKEQKKELDNIKKKIASERAVLGVAYKIMKQENGK